MKLTIYQVDAFTAKLFGGNPAAVVPLQKWLPAKKMQQLAMENNLSETVFFAPSKNKEADYDIRWFTPAVEINLCGHATLAASHIIFQELKPKKKKIVFNSQSGLLQVTRNGEKIEMDFPSWKPKPVTEIPEGLAAALGNVPIESLHQSRDLMVVLKDEAAVLQCQPDFGALKEIAGKVIVTAPGATYDFVSRFFAPGVGVDEDPVTGSAHSQLIPYWSEQLGKKKMKAKQLSTRGGVLGCVQLNEERVLMIGTCVLYMKGKFQC